jgi:ketosteroid isomerase-like protein
MLSIASIAQSKSETEVAAAVESLRKAMIDADKATLERLTAAELSYGHSSGKIEDKASFVQALVSGQSDFLEITLTDQTITIKDKVALVRHKLSGNTNDPAKGPAPVNLGILLVWVKEKSGWKLAARQAFKL